MFKLTASDYHALMTQSMSLLKEIIDSDHEELWGGYHNEQGLAWDINVFDGDLFGEGGLYHCTLHEMAVSTTEEGMTRFEQTGRAVALWDMPKEGLTMQVYDIAEQDDIEHLFKLG